MREERERVVREEPDVVREEPAIIREEPTIIREEPATIVRSGRPSAVVADRDNFLGPVLAVIAIVALLGLVIWFFTNGPGDAPAVPNDGGAPIQERDVDPGVDTGTGSTRGEADTGSGTDAGQESNSGPGTEGGADAGAEAGAEAGTGTETSP